jgi:type II secretory pathway component PulF
MNIDEFGFFNRQLSAMLTDGIPLEGALHQLSGGMRRGVLKRELGLLEGDLQRGIPLKDAITKRTLPELYVRMIQAGLRSNNLPGVLTMLADHYHRTYGVWTRLKGLMVYPLMVLAAAFAVSFLLASLCAPLAKTLYGPVANFISWNAVEPSADGLVSIQVWVILPCVLLGIALLLLSLLATIPALRRRALWVLPAFKEANLSRFASCMELSLQGGSDLRDALATARILEGRSPLGTELISWEKRLASGCKRLRDIGEGSRWVPPLFVWLVDSCGEDWADGFRQARTIYGARASARAEMFLYAFLPVSILTLAALIAAQLLPLVKLLTQAVNYL